MKLLKAKQIDYPQWYAEYDLNSLTITVDRFNKKLIKKVAEDIYVNGLVYPIVIRSPYKDYQTDPNPDVSSLSNEERSKVFNVFVGNKRIIAARMLDYTHISAYHVKRDEDARMLCGKTQIRDFLTDWSGELDGAFR